MLHGPTQTCSRSGAALGFLNLYDSLARLNPCRQEWMDSEEGVPLPLHSVMDVLANLYNTGAGEQGGPPPTASCMSCRVRV